MCKKQLTTGLVRPALENRSLVWGPLCLGLNDKLEKVQNMQLVFFVSQLSNHNGEMEYLVWEAVGMDSQKESGKGRVDGHKKRP